MENLRLVEVHRRKVSFLIALLILLLIYSGILVFKLTSYYFIEKQNDDILIFKANQLKGIVQIYEDPENTGDPIRDKVLLSYLEGSLIRKNGEITTSRIQNPDYIYDNIPAQNIQNIAGKKYYLEELNNEKDTLQILVERDMLTFTEHFGKTLLLLLLMTPFVFSFLAFICCRFMSQVYRPLIEIISSLESFATNINHEFKTSLTEIISSLELAKITQEYEQANEHSSNSARRLNRILDSLGQLIHFVNSDYRKEKINLIEVLSECVSDYKNILKEKEVEVLYIPDMNTSVHKYIDKSPLILCFQNILKNAIKFSHKEGVIEIDITENSFSIKDYGVGIEEENLDKIFDKYFRESYVESGSGIGLSIIKRITETYNWEVDIQSKKGEYTKVSIFF